MLQRLDAGKTEAVSFVVGFHWRGGDPRGHTKGDSNSYTSCKHKIAEKVLT